MWKIRIFYTNNRNEIMNSVVDKTQPAKNKAEKKEIEEKIQRERKRIKALLIIGIIYVLIGSILLLLLTQGNLTNPSYIVISIELMLLGIYVLLYAIIFYSIHNNWDRFWLLKFFKEVAIFAMLPYHISLKRIKAFLHDTNQEHVAYLLPYYLISLFIIIFSYVLIIKMIAGCHIDEAFNEMLGFIIVFILINEFFLLGKFFAFYSTKEQIRSTQKAEVKKVSKVNWRRTLNDNKHREERITKFNNEWNIVKNELEYTKLYVYILVTILILCIPKKDGTFGELLSNQFFGITTIAALAREAKSK